ncbi:hypothetical protein A9G13_07605 [Gilliamella sp. wkB178]|uniref:DUF4145 domain-containing protein n=1 Tax=Gilliamella sp. wkB178 TaxID=3120259 RepID=UPI00080DC5B8|nr:DUF4145 domain-containing protein [Gilliamella apicola]OCG08053.1 hypothetical protein A9G13_07605 [Gilliamella apicola]
MAFYRVCPFCNKGSTILDYNIQHSGSLEFDEHSDSNSYRLNILSICCPTPECQKHEIFFRKFKYNKDKKQYELVYKLNIEPKANIKNFPDYVPKQILKDYEEAKLILDLSPKASATLSRRCLQGMIRDFWKVQKKTLHAEIDAIKDQMNDDDMYNAIMALKSIGNIGAHPEHDINLIIDVEPEEANELAGLIETLIEDWYIAREARKERINRINNISIQKQIVKNGTP